LTVYFTSKKRSISIQKKEGKEEKLYRLNVAFPGLVSAIAIMLSNAI
jgi:hypothetical protein